MTAINKLRLPSVDSTNAELRRRAADGLVPHGLAICAVEQTAGRGQRGNSWESEPGANATMSMMLRPGHVDARRQFLLSMAVSLGVTEAITRFTEGAEVSIKWPNDIYIGDGKVCGILIENTLNGSQVAASIVGVGVNVNQTRFISDAPNPVSIAMITGGEHDVKAVENAMITNIMSEAEALDRALAADDEDYVQAMHARYMSRLWRREGEHPYVDTATSLPFMARIADVAADGTLTLIDSEGHTRRYLFKEVSFTL